MPLRVRKTRKLRGHSATASLGSTASSQEATAMLEACISTGPASTSTITGNFGRAGMRRYHLKRSQHCCPTVTLDKLWTLVSEQTLVNAAKNKTELLLSIMCVAGLLQRSEEGKAPWAVCPHEGQKNK